VSRVRGSVFSRPIFRIAVVGVLVVPLVGVEASGAAAIAPGASEPAPAAPEALPDEKSASEAAQRFGVQVEVLAKRGETSEVKANPDGTFTWYEHLRPIWARSADGGWARPDATLHRTADGSVVPTASTFPMSFSGGGDAPLATVARNGTELRLGWPGRLPSPVLSGSTAIYQEVLPGVDLRIDAAVDGFSHAFVVKNRAAAANPALRTIKLTTRTKGLNLHVDSATGAVSARDAAGRIVLGGATPLMWDATGTAADPARIARDIIDTRVAGLPATQAGAGEMPTRQSPLRARVRPGELELVTDPALLTGPDVKYPVIVDPSWSGWRNHWTLLWKEFGGTSYYDTLSVTTGDSTYGVFRAGHQSGFGDGISTVRAAVELDTSGVRGKHILSANFRVYQTWASKGCGNGPEAGAPVDVWHINAISSGTVWNTAWNSNGSGWVANLGGDNKSVRRVDSTGGCAPNYIRFDVTGRIATNAGNTWCSGGCSAITLGLRAESETNQYSWKRYQVISNRTDTRNPVLEIDYNTVPGMPTAQSTNSDSRCVLGAGRPYLGDTTPTFAATMHDGDDSVRAVFEWSKVDGTSAGSLTTGVVGDNAPVSHTPTLTAGNWRWRVYATDGVDNSGATEYCEFTIEPPGVGTSPPLPTVTSDDFVYDDFGPRLVGEPGMFHFSPGGATDVVAYRYGFRNDALTMTVRARPDGTADAPITMWHDNPAQLWVQSIDRAGNASIGTDGTPATGMALYLFQAIGNAGPFPHRDSDLNGDGYGDLIVMQNAGGNRTQFWSFFGKSDGTLLEPVNVFDAPGFDPTKLKTAIGDFDGDGKADVAALRNEGSGRSTLHILRSDGNALTGFPVWDSATAGGGMAWDWTQARVVAGNVTGTGSDQLDDIVVAYPLSTASWQLRVFRSTSTPTALSFATPTVWQTMTSDLNKITVHAGDFNGDGRTDVGEVQDLGSRISLWIHISNGSAFSSVRWYDDPARSWNWSLSKFAAGDFDGNGRDDLVAYYQWPNYRVIPYGFYARTDADAFYPPLMEGDDMYPNDWSWDWTTWEALAKTDINGDGDDEPMVVQRCCGPMQASLVTWYEGLSFPFEMGSYAPWTGALGPPHYGAVYPLAYYTTMHVVTSHSNKCFEVPGSSMANLVQLVTKCEAATALNDDFYINPLNSFYYLQPKHSAASNKCVNISGGVATNGAAVIQFDCGFVYGNDIYRLEYVAGTGADIVVHIKPVFSNMCVDVASSGTADGTLIQQWTCNNTAAQDFYLRPA